MLYLKYFTEVVNNLLSNTTRQKDRFAALEKDTILDNNFSALNPVPHQDLLIKEGWVRVIVDVVPKTNEQIVMLIKSNTKGKVMGIIAFNKYLEELVQKYHV